jgi:hypothetical protein
LLVSGPKIASQKRHRTPPLFLLLVFGPKIASQKRHRTPPLFLLLVFGPKIASQKRHRTPFLFLLLVSGPKIASQKHRRCRPDRLKRCVHRSPDRSFLRACHQRRRLQASAYSASPMSRTSDKSTATASKIPSMDDGETSSAMYSLYVSFLFTDLVSISSNFVVFFARAIWLMQWPEVEYKRETIDDTSYQGPLTMMPLATTSMDASQRKSLLLKEQTPAGSSYLVPNTM